ncbi:MAG: hypothetical protein JSW07_03250, partial [bacterium]
SFFLLNINGFIGCCIPILYQIRNIESMKNKKGSSDAAFSLFNNFALGTITYKNQPAVGKTKGEIP